MDILGVEFPIKTIDDFEAFENSLNGNKGDADVQEEVKNKRTFLASNHKIFDQK